MDISRNDTAPALAERTDEQLIASIRQDGSRPAEDELLRRHLPTIHRYVAHAARAQHLPDAEVPDAQQEVAEAVRRALGRFELAADGQAVSRPFLPFLFHVSKDALIDFARRFHRRRKHVEASRAVAAAVEAGGDVVCRVFGCPNTLDPEVGDPARIAMQREQWVRLEEAVQKLGDRARSVWEGVLRGANFLELAAELGVSHKTVLRCWETIGVTLQARFPELCGVGLQPAPEDGRSETRPPGVGPDVAAQGDV